eukprot:TRINITY_DN7446_c0_g2_i1.p1 TRINITY_DN7446_c0_g2~~TRINITY_DN7446_c0_g2_i1.p1  ORF type:complete len:830 (+),score=156.02 TRINITY_DN7446_c0_g2_i1:144-2633(+)
MAPVPTRRSLPAPGGSATGAQRAQLARRAQLAVASLAAALYAGMYYAAVQDRAEPSTEESTGGLAVAGLPPPRQEQPRAPTPQREQPQGTQQQRQQQQRRAESPPPAAAAASEQPAPPLPPRRTRAPPRTRMAAQHAAGGRGVAQKAAEVSTTGLAGLRGSAAAQGRAAAESALVGRGAALRDQGSAVLNRRRTSCQQPPPQPPDNEMFLARESGRANATAEAGEWVPPHLASNPWFREAYREGVEQRDGYVEALLAQQAGRESLGADPARTLGHVPPAWRVEDAWATHFLLGQVEEALERSGVSTPAPACLTPDDIGYAEAAVEVRCVRPLKDSPGLTIEGASWRSTTRVTAAPPPVSSGWAVRADAPTPAGLAHAAESSGGVIAILLGHGDAFYWRMLRSVCRYIPTPHPIIMFWTAADPSPSAALRKLSVAVLNGPDCRTKRQLWWVFLPEAHWNGTHPVRTGREDPSVNAPAYHRMCWFWHYGVFHLPVLDKVEYLLRLDSDSEFGSTPAVDPIQAVRLRKAAYGYNTFCFDNPQFTKGMWFHVRRFVMLPGGSPLFEGFSVPERCQVDPECPEPVPMFYTNFEVLRLSFFREPAVDRWLRSCHRGVFLSRWGDAPLRGVTLGMFATKEQVVHLNDFAYAHGRPRSLDATAIWPASAGRNGNDMSVDWDRNREPWWTPVVSEDVGLARLGLYWAGICFRKPVEKGMQVLNCDRWQAHCAPPATAPIPAELASPARCPEPCDRCPADCSRVIARRARRIARRLPGAYNNPERWCVLGLPPSMRGQLLRQQWCSTFSHTHSLPRCAAQQATRDWQLPPSVTNGSFGG